MKDRLQADKPVVVQLLNVPCAETCPSTSTVDVSTDINSDGEQQIMCDEDCNSFGPETSSASGEFDIQLASFYMWMMSPDGGLKDEKSAKQHITQVKSIFVACGSEEISSLWQHGRYVYQFCKKNNLAMPFNRDNGTAGKDWSS